ncbi:MAG: bifunctional folylpolyglutamate synthase/dihydrofolate synthase [Bacteroidales bacterium]|nr:bifunctional folylpolyglutamate synthase/dihydrofolate synthase [Bacteroidales bacterium]MDT8431571.1 folylpolyglutamate synthase/dihydrofolate synthase family protein [Bacteroidales bacterium]
MNYAETIEFLFSSLPMYQRTGKAAYKANLDNTHALDLALGHPHRHFSSVHIAGTNGKGSVSHMLASVLQEAGYRTGLYTSPHLVDFRERIRINGMMISEDHVVGFVERSREVIDRVQPSFFEMTVAMAFDHFAREKVDIAVIETGMGGRLDSTNIITPEVSALTRISLDHTEFLGNTETLIAAEKAGIIKDNVPVTVGSNNDAACDVFRNVAAQKNSPIHFAAQERTFTFQTYTTGQQAIFHFRNIESQSEESYTSDLTGTYQHENLSLVLTTIKVLQQRGWIIPGPAISNGLGNVKKNTSIRGRWELLGANPRIICDTAHNASGVQVVMEQLQQVPHRQLHIVWGMVGDKPVETIFRYLPRNAAYYFTQPSIPRAMPLETLLEHAAMNGLPGSAHATVGKAYQAATLAAKAEDTIFIGGSTFVVADLLAHLG